MNHKSDGVRRLARRSGLAIGVSTLALALVAPTAAFAASTKIVSASTSGARGNSDSGEPTLSKDGHYTAFFSEATNLVAGNDTNNSWDCFLRDNWSKTTKRISVRNGGGESNGNCFGPAISDNGQIIAFESEANNLVTGDTNGTWDIFVRDVGAGTTERVSVATGGGQANGSSRDPDISKDGRYVVFESFAANLVGGSDTNGAWDIYVHDRNLGTTTRVSVRSDESQGSGPSRDPAISGNGRYVVFDSKVANLAGSDTNGTWDVFRRDLVNTTTDRMSKSSSGKKAKGGASRNATISETGRYVAFDSKARNLVQNDVNGKLDVFLRDTQAKKTSILSKSTRGARGKGNSLDPTISNNGRWVSFTSYAPNLVSGDSNGRADVFVRDRKNGKTKRVSLTSKNAQARNGDSRDSTISGNGKVVAFESNAPNMVYNPKKGVMQVYKRGPLY